jgi:hypothetical protein
MPLEVTGHAAQGEVHTSVFQAGGVVIDETGRIDGN